MNRYDEVEALMKLSEQAIIKKAGKCLVVCDSLDDLHKKFAEDIANEIINNNENSKPSKFILPVGPTGQYPYLVKIFQEKSISLENCWFFFMDEYCDIRGEAIAEDHPLSFKRIAKQKFLNILPEDSKLNPNQVIFPDELNIHKISSIIEELGGIDVCYGGIGIHGHIAFNEPEEGIKNLSCRKVKLNDYTITINAVRAEIGGNLENFPKYAFTIGMKEILEANKIRLYCRNGTDYDWANAILRIALLGRPGDDYPVTHIRNKDYIITTDNDTLRTPKNLL